MNLPCHAIRLFLILAALLPPAGTVFAKMLILTDPPETTLDKRNVYPEKLLKAVLEKTRPAFGDYEIRETKIAMDRKRLLFELERGVLVNLSAKASQAAWETRLTPIRIPIDKGIGGYRVFHIRKEDQPRFAAVSSLEDLKHLRVGAQTGWSSVPVYQVHNFSLITGNNYEGLFGMLSAGRFDYMPRGLEEIFIEHDLRRAQYPNLAVEQQLLLYYPFPKYFFASPANPKLAERIRTGLLALIADGNFDRLFYEHHAKLLQRAKLCQRRLFQVSNPELSDKTPYNIKKYWFDPQKQPAKYGGCLI